VRAQTFVRNFHPALLANVRQLNGTEHAALPNTLLPIESAHLTRVLTAALFNPLKTKIT
jgi:hypothetical protein